MSRQMLIDARHEGETRVVVQEGDEIDDFDFITASKVQLKGNIFLAKVTRVEPSLQAAFVEYGGNKQGFLPFSEIHPDYFQIPVEDKKRLLEEEAEAAAREEEEEDQEDDEGRGKKRNSRRRRGGRGRRRNKEEQENETETEDDTQHSALENPADEVSSEEISADNDNAPEEAEDDGEEKEEADTVIADESEELRKQKGNSFKRYKIQEVVKRGQIMLVQVIKEERGNKGCSMTSYISLAGRYCVLMPNSLKAGGVSRKISNGEQRKKLKSILQEFKDKRGLNAIIRTAGLDRTKAEIKRDYEYLVKVWNQIRETTLSSTAPALIYEESDIIKRSIRDMYTSDIEQVMVQGDNAYKDAKNFMKLIMPSHAPRVKQYKEARPLFAEYEAEDALASIYEPEVRLPSGGSLVIQSTEALISIDVNSGRSTSERNVEETAIKTNLEAAKEVARQLRLRDLAGIVVVDFIDMYYSKNRRNLERAMRDALKRDRAKIQLSRISPFGLIELSRQRLRPSITESNMVTCRQCKGTGIVPSEQTSLIQVIRILERESVSGDYKCLKIESTPAIVLQMMNEKRDLIRQLEEENNIEILFGISTDAVQGEYTIIKTLHDGKIVTHDEKDSPRRGKRRGKRGGRSRKRPNQTAEARQEEGAPTEESADAPAKEQGTTEPAKARPRRGRRKKEETSPNETPAEQPASEETQSDDGKPEKKSRAGRKASPRRKRSATKETDDAPKVQETTASPEPAQPAEPVNVADEQKNPQPAVIVDHGDQSDDKPKKKGWWNRVV